MKLQPRKDAKERKSIKRFWWQGQCTQCSVEVGGPVAMDTTSKILSVLSKVSEQLKGENGSRRSRANG